MDSTHLKVSRTKKGRFRNDLVSLVDIGPTILEYAGIKAPESFQGRSFFKQDRDKRGYERFIISELITPSLQQFKTVYFQDYKLIIDSEKNLTSLFNLSKDPDEKYELSITGKNKFSSIRSKLHDILKSKIKKENILDLIWDELLIEKKYPSKKNLIREENRKILQELKALGYTQ